MLTIVLESHQLAALENAGSVTVDGVTLFTGGLVLTTQKMVQITYDEVVSLICGNVITKGSYKIKARKPKENKETPTVENEMQELDPNKVKGLGLDGKDRSDDAGYPGWA